MLKAHPDYPVSRTDAVYVDIGEIPLFDSLDSNLTVVGANYFDPNGELRRSGKVFQSFVTAEGHYKTDGDT
jgi:hypothetical protein